MSRKFKIGDGVAVKLWSGVRVGRVIRAGPKQISVDFAGDGPSRRTTPTLTIASCLWTWRSTSSCT